MIGTGLPLAAGLRLQGRRPAAVRPLIDAVLELNGEWQDKQNENGEIDPNSGGNVVFLSPGLRLASNNWSGFATVGIPIVNDLNGLQSEPTYRLFGGVLVGF